MRQIGGLPRERRARQSEWLEQMALEHLGDRAAGDLLEHHPEQHSVGVAVVKFAPRREQCGLVPGVVDQLLGRDSDRPPARSDHTRIGSVTKTFTVIALLQLVDRGEVCLADTIGTYIPGLPNGDTATLRDLARMTSGIPSYNDNLDFVRAWAADPAGTVVTPRCNVWKSRAAQRTSPPSFNRTAGAIGNDIRRETNRR